MSSWTAPEHRERSNLLGDHVPYYSDTKLELAVGDIAGRILPSHDDKRLVHLEECYDRIYEVKDTGFVVAQKEYNWDECVRTSISIGSDDLVQPLQQNKKLFCVDGVWLDYRDDFDRTGEAQTTDRERGASLDDREPLYQKCIEVDGRSVTIKTRDDQIHGYGYNSRGRSNGWKVVWERDNQESWYLKKDEDVAQAAAIARRKKLLAKAGLQ